MGNVKVLLDEFNKVEKEFLEKVDVIIGRFAQYFREKHIVALKIADGGQVFHDPDDQEYVCTHIVLDDGFGLVAACRLNDGDMTPDETFDLKKMSTNFIFKILYFLNNGYLEDVNDPEEIGRLLYLAENGVPASELEAIGV